MNVILEKLAMSQEQSENKERPAVAGAPMTRDEAFRKMKEHCVDVLMGQTTWDRERATSELEANGYNVQACVRIFMGLPPNKDESSATATSRVQQEKRKMTTNQAIYGSIRGMMDEASRRYEKKKEMEDKLQAAREAYQRQLGGSSKVASVTDAPSEQ